MWLFWIFRSCAAGVVGSFIKLSDKDDVLHPVKVYGELDLFVCLFVWNTVYILRSKYVAEALPCLEYFIIHFLKSWHCFAFILHFQEHMCSCEHNAGLISFFLLFYFLLCLLSHHLLCRIKHSTSVKSVSWQQTCLFLRGVTL